MKRWISRCFICALALRFVLLSTVWLPVSAEETNADVISAELPTEPVSQSVLTVGLPVDNRGVFDFIMDPCRLITATGAAKYEGRPYEEGATLFFLREDDTFSSQSDYLNVENYGVSPIQITIHAKLDTFGQFGVFGDPLFTDHTEASMWLAIVDAQGNTVSLDEAGNASLTVELPGNRHQWTYDEAVGTYVPEPVYALEDDTVPVYSFGLKGACNPDGAWDDLAVNPVVTLTWEVSLLQQEPAEPSSPREVVDQPQEREQETGTEMAEVAEEAAAPQSQDDSDGAYLSQTTSETAVEPEEEPAPPDLGAQERQEAYIDPAAMFSEPAESETPDGELCGYPPAPVESVTPEDVEAEATPTPVPTPEATPAPTTPTSVPEQAHTAIPTPTGNLTAESPAPVEPEAPEPTAWATPSDLTLR